MKNKKLQIHSQAHLNAVVAAALQRGFGVDDLTDYRFVDNHDKPVYVYNKGDRLTWKAGKDAHPSWPSFTLDQLFTANPEAPDPPKPKTAKVRLNNSLTAVVTEDSDTVKVGCQNIDIQSVYDVITAYESI